jgi:hypothetical protein
LLAERRARVERLTSMCSGGRAVVELLAHLDGGAREILWPVAVVAEYPNERSIVFRSYFSQWPVDGRSHLRPAFLDPTGARPSDVVGRHQAALEVGDTETVVGTFEPDGYVREPIGPDAVHRGTAELHSFFTARFAAGGGIGLQPCAVTDDGRRCAVEYNVIRWGGRDVTPQAGLGIYERGADGLLAAARLYDDVERRPSTPEG